MIDICKLSKKSKICDFIFKYLLNIKINKIFKEVYHSDKLDLDIKDFFFIIIKKKIHLLSGEVKKLKNIISQIMTCKKTMN